MPFPALLSVVVVVRNRQAALAEVLSHWGDLLSGWVRDYELVVVDNASDDGSIATLKLLTREGGLPNLQIYALTKEVDPDTAASVGLENALGDLVAVVDPWADDLAFLPTMFVAAAAGAEVVFARNQAAAGGGWLYRAAHALFYRAYQGLSGVHLAREAPPFRLLSRRVVNFVLQHPQPAVTYRHLPATGGFSRANLEYRAEGFGAHARPWGRSIERSLRLLVSTSGAPLRLMTVLSAFGALANVLYSAYVVVVGLFKADVAPGWISLSLQQSGMFFLISLVLLILGEYVVQVAQAAHHGPPYHVAQEFMSARILWRERLNVDEQAAQPTPRPEARRTARPVRTALSGRDDGN